MSSKMSRRKFLETGAMAAAGLTVVPSSVLGKSFGHTAPSDKLNIAGVGIGGMGFANLKNLESENIVALADVDWKYSDRVFKYFPKAKKYYDYRKMYDEMGKSIDAVVGEKHRCRCGCHRRSYPCAYSSRCHNDGKTRVCAEAIDS